MHYILKTVLKDALGLEVSQTFDAAEFTASTLPKINYSENKFENALNVKPHIVLFDIGVKDYPIEVNNNDRFFKVFFKNSGQQIPFDLFGAAFWLLSRYEEYLPFKTDNFNRFNYRSSLAYQYDFIQVPLVNLWLNELHLILKELFPALKFNERAYNFVSTIDIDNAFKFKHKGFVRAIAGYLKDILSKDE